MSGEKRMGGESSQMSRRRKKRMVGKDGKERLAAVKKQPKERKD